MTSYYYEDNNDSGAGLLVLTLLICAVAIGIKIACIWCCVAKLKKRTDEQGMTIVVLPAHNATVS